MGKKTKVAKNNDSKVKMLKETFDLWIQEGHFTLSEIAVGLHNSCVHGKPMIENGNYVLGEGNSDQYLGELFDGFDKVIDAANKMQNC